MIIKIIVCYLILVLVMLIISFYIHEYKEDNMNVLSRQKVLEEYFKWIKNKDVVRTQPFVKRVSKNFYLYYYWDKTNLNVFLLTKDGLSFLKLGEFPKFYRNYWTFPEPRVH